MGKTGLFGLHWGDTSSRVVGVAFTSCNDRNKSERVAWVLRDCSKREKET